METEERSAQTKTKQIPRALRLVPRGMVKNSLCEIEAIIRDKVTNTKC